MKKNKQKGDKTGKKIQRPKTQSEEMLAHMLVQVQMAKSAQSFAWRM
jgi:hypothetical protein